MNDELLDDGIVDENVLPSLDDNLSSQASNEKAKAYTEILQLFNFVAEWNPNILFDNATQILVACQQLILNYNQQCVSFIESDDHSSLLHHITDDGMTQWELHKAFKSNYNVYIY